MPEVKTYFSRVGTAEVATDPMPPNISDGYVMLKDRRDWPDPDKTKAQLVSEIEERLEAVPGNAFEISQPIELRFNELISGVRSDVGIKIYGDDLDQLLRSGNAIAKVLNGIEGAEGVKVEQVAGLPVLSVEPNRAALRQAPLSTCCTNTARPSSTMPNTNNRNTGKTSAVSTAVVPNRVLRRGLRNPRIIAEIVVFSE